MGIGDEKYVSLTTFTRDGRPKPTPVWIADLGDGTVGFTTALNSWKARRIRATPKVVVQPCNVRGQLRDGTRPAEGIAEVVTGAGYEAVRAKVSEKYGIQFAATGALDKVRALFGRSVGEVCGIVITLDP